MQNIIQEIGRKTDNPESYLICIAKNAAYGKHPLGREGLGTEESVSRFSREDFIRFHKQYYHAGNLNFIVAGRLPRGGKKSVVRLFSEYFEGLPKAAPNNRKVIATAEGRRLFYQEKRQMAQVQAALIAPTGPGYLRQVDIVLSVFDAMISGGTSFPLFVEVRDKLGLCYSIGAENIRQSDLGFFIVYVGTDPIRYSEAIEKIFEVIEASKSDNYLLERAKKLILGRMALGHGNPIGIIVRATEDIGIGGRPRESEEISELIKSVRIEDIQRVVDFYLGRDKFTRVFLTPENINVPENPLR